MLRSTARAFSIFRQSMVSTSRGTAFRTAGMHVRPSARKLHGLVMAGTGIGAAAWMLTRLTPIYKYVYTYNLHIEVMWQTISLK